MRALHAVSSSGSRAAINGKRFCFRTALQTGSTRPFSATRIFDNAEEALEDLNDGATCLFGGFGLCGIPENIIAAIKKKGTKELTIASNNMGANDFGLGTLLQDKQIKRVIASFPGEASDLQTQYFAGEIEVQLVPQGTLAEKMRAAGAGIPAFFTPTAYGTPIQTGGHAIRLKGPLGDELMSEPLETRVWKGRGGKTRNYVLETALFGDFSFVKGWKADRRGNVIFRGTTKSFNQVVAAAGNTCVVEVEEIVETGEFPPEDVHLPCIYVDRVFKGKAYEKRIGKLMTTGGTGDKKVKPERERICRRAALEFQTGMYANLGIGIPTLAGNFVPEGIDVVLHSENGLLGIGPYPTADQVDADWINAGKETVTPIPGASTFDSATSFGMVRGGHVDLTMLGALQVGQHGDLANWIVPGKKINGMGGAMDLVGSGNRVVITMEHTAKGGAHKIVEQCTLPLTGMHCVNAIITEMGVFDVDPKDGLMLIEIAEGISLDDVKAATGAPFKVADNLIAMRQA